jgi:hypothetical protein
MAFFTSKKFLGIVLGATYGLLIRFGMASPHVHPFISGVSTAFLWVCPFSVGAIAVLLGAERGVRITARQQIALATSAMGVFLFAMFATLLEGLICVVLVVPVFMVASVLGGFVGGAIHNVGNKGPATLPVLALLPFLVGLLEGALPSQRSEQSVTNTIHVMAPPAAVFDKLADVRAIQPRELGFAFVHLIGLPKPIEARMDGHGPGSVRTSRWEKQVWFQEVTTEWRRPHALRYRFVVPKGAIPREALDEHVEINGDYFELVDGGYTLVPTLDGGTDLSLTTRFVNKSRLTTYGNLWGKLVLKDFHGAILGLMKSRAESAPTKEQTIYLESHNSASDRSAIFEDDGQVAYLYLTRSGSTQFERDAIAYMRIPPIDRTQFEARMRAKETPLLLAEYASAQAVMAAPSEDALSFRWSRDGEAVAILHDGVPLAFAVAAERFGYSKAVSRDGPFAHPWDGARYDAVFGTTL